jgi:hypothetical protein
LPLLPGDLTPVWELVKDKITPSKIKPHLEEKPA